jgi:hypothetical protein
VGDGLQSFQGALRWQQHVVLLSKFWPNRASNSCSQGMVLPGIWQVDVGRGSGGRYNECADDSVH